MEGDRTTGLTYDVLAAIREVEEAQAAGIALEDIIGHVFGGYRVECRLGAGGMGEVYACSGVEVGAQPEAALKCLPWVDTMDEQRVARFHIEALTLTRLKHPGIVRSISHGQAHGRFYILMELVPGEPLSDVVARGALPDSEARRVAHSLTASLQFAHENDVVHRDLKPENVVLRPEGDPVVLDLGVARDPQSRVGGTEHGCRVGTPRFMAPEQARGRLDQIDQRTDVYGLGLILFSLHTGNTPFPNTQPDDLIKAVLLGNHPDSPLRTLRARSSKLALICQKCLQFRRRDRYQSMRALAKDLEAVGSGSPLSISRAHFWRLSLVSFLSRHLVWAVSLTAIVVIGLLSLLLNQSSLRESQAKLAADTSQELANAKEAEAQHLAGLSAKGQSGLLSLAKSLEASEHPRRRGDFLVESGKFWSNWPAEASIGDENLTAWGWSSPTDLQVWAETRGSTLDASDPGGSVAHVATPAEGLRRLALEGPRATWIHEARAPSGDRLAIHKPARTPDEKASLLVEAPEGMALVELTKVLGNLLFLEWSPDSSMLAAVSETDCWVWSSDDWSLLHHASEPFHSSAAWSPIRLGSRPQFCLALTTSEGLLKVWSRGSSPIDLWHHSGALHDVAWSPDGGWLASAGADGNRLWDATSLDHVRLLTEGRSLFPSSLAWSPNSTTLATLVQDGSPRIRLHLWKRPQIVRGTHRGRLGKFEWSRHTEDLAIERLPAPDASLQAVRTRPPTPRAATTVEIWNPSARRPRVVLRGHSPAWLSDGSLLVASGRGVLRWDPATGETTRRWVESGQVFSLRSIGRQQILVSSRQGTQLALALRKEGGTGRQEIAITTVQGLPVGASPRIGQRTMRLFQNLKPVPSGIGLFAMPFSDEKLACLLEEGELRLWGDRSKSALQIQCLPTSGNVDSEYVRYKSSLEWSRDGSYIAAIFQRSPDRLFLYDWQERQAIPYEVNQKLTAISWSPQREILAFGSVNPARLTALAVGRGPREVGTVGLPARAEVLAWTPDGSILLAGLLNGAVVGCAPGSSSLLFDLGSHDGPVSELGISPSGATVASLGEDSKLRLRSIRGAQLPGDELLRHVRKLQHSRGNQ